MSDTKKRDMAKEMLDYLLKKGDESNPTGSNPSQKATRLLDVNSPTVSEVSIEPAKETRLNDPTQNTDKASREAPQTIQAGTFVMDFDLGSDKESDLTTEGPIPEVDSLIVKKDTTAVVEDTVKQTKSTDKFKADIPKEEKSDPSKKGSKSIVQETIEPSKPVLPTQFQFGAKTQQSAMKTPQTESASPITPFSSTRSATVFNEVSSLVSGSEAVRVAQARISTLERERDELRDEMEKLLSSSESYQRRMNEIKAQHEALERKHRQKVEILEEEKAVLQGRLKARESELQTVKKQNEELQSRFQSDLRRVRVRERELESRLELLKAESATLLRSKDDLIVELRRQLEQLSFELDNFRAKSADLNSKVTEFYERNHRTVKALRLALSVLEIGDGDDNKGKKATG